MGLGFWVLGVGFRVLGLGFRVELGFRTCLVYWGYIGIMEKKMETTRVIRVI